mmetsp:Transcript_1399/g.6023  ORF Transcript_1399/g.6023 Transcript_1399/m.6023 type:complete len:422 (+) Transcript_1399:2866-4131(+)
MGLESNFLARVFVIRVQVHVWVKIPVLHNPICASGEQAILSVEEDAPHRAVVGSDSKDRAPLEPLRVYCDPPVHQPSHQVPICTSYTGRRRRQVFLRLTRPLLKVPEPHPGVQARGCNALHDARTRRRGRRVLATRSVDVVGVALSFRSAFATVCGILLRVRDGLREGHKGNAGHSHSRMRIRDAEDGLLRIIDIEDRQRSVLISHGKPLAVKRDGRDFRVVPRDLVLKGSAEEVVIVLIEQLLFVVVLFVVVLRGIDLHCCVRLLSCLGTHGHCVFVDERHIGRTAPGAIGHQRPGQRHSSDLFDRVQEVVLHHPISPVPSGHTISFDDLIAQRRDAPLQNAHGAAAKAAKVSIFRQFSVICDHAKASASVAQLEASPKSCCRESLHARAERQSEQTDLEPHPTRWSRRDTRRRRVLPRF